jgi:hypothetical protein
MTIILTSVFTIIGGVIVYALGQLLSKFVIEPIVELKKIIGEVSFNLAFHAVTIYTPNGGTSEQFKTAREALIKSSCDLSKQVNIVPFYPSKFCPSKKDIEKSAKDLLALSTYLHETDSKEYQHEKIGKIVAKIKQNLNLESGDHD